jgi:hypothetical protein
MNEDSQTLPPDPPFLLAIILCDAVIEDKNTNKKSLIGMFDSVNTPSLPTIGRMTLYVAFTNWLGERQLSLRAIGPSGQVVFNVQGNWKSDNPMGLVDMVLVCEAIPLMEVGPHEITALIDGVPLGERRFMVNLIPIAPMPAG